MTSESAPGAREELGAHPQVAAAPPIRLTGGTVAFNEEKRIVVALRSLLDQELPGGASWDRIIVVASGCTDRTAELARSVDPKVEVIEQPTRSGKAAALLEIFGRARGEFVVLLNGDAQAEPGAVLELLAWARNRTGAFAIMARPEPPSDRTGGFTESIRLLWDIHHRFHSYILEVGEGSNLSDELLLLPVDHLPPLPSGVVNDGGFIGAWLRKERGQLLYAPRARVRIEAARRFRDHVVQRRRIRWGLRQVEEVVGVAPMTLQRYAVTHPRAAAGLLASAVHHRRKGMASLLALAAAETVALGLSWWDRVPPRRDHTLWATLPD